MTSYESNRLDLPDPTVTARGRGVTGMEYQIIGTTMQAVILELDPGETVYSESGAMSWMSGNIQMATNTRGGGLGGMFKRAISGESLFLNEFTSAGGKGIIAFASDFPGKIVPVALAEGQTMIVQKQAFLCAEKTVGLDIHFRKRMGAGFFGGEGFIAEVDRSGSGVRLSRRRDCRVYAGCGAGAEGGHRTRGDVRADGGVRHRDGEGVQEHSAGWRRVVPDDAARTGTCLVADDADRQPCQGDCAVHRDEFIIRLRKIGEPSGDASGARSVAFVLNRVNLH